MEKLLDSFVSRSCGILGCNLCGIYLHGSSAMDCFNPEKSDIDLIVIVNNGIPDDIKRQFMEMVVELNSSAPPKGIEMSIVRRNACDPFIYPTPYELHFSAGHLSRYRDDPDAYIREMRGTDRDLAAHFTIIRRRGRCLYGLPAEYIIGEVPEKDYLDSILFDIGDAGDGISEDPVYFILNLARVLAYCAEGAVLSKKEGGEWALLNVPSEFAPLVRCALEEYTENKNASYDGEYSKRYAEYMLKRISEYTERTDFRS